MIYTLYINSLNSYWSVLYLNRLSTNSVLSKQNVSSVPSSLQSIHHISNRSSFKHTIIYTAHPRLFWAAPASLTTLHSFEIRQIRYDCYYLKKLILYLKPSSFIKSRRCGLRGLRNLISETFRQYVSFRPRERGKVQSF